MMNGGATVNMERLIRHRVLGTPVEMAPANAWLEEGNKQIELMTRYIICELFHQIFIVSL